MSEKRLCCAVMRINMDCNACCRKVRRILINMKEVETHVIEKKERKIIVCGQFRPSDIAVKLQKKMKRRVEILEIEHLSGDHGGGEEEHYHEPQYEYPVQPDQKPKNVFDLPPSPPSLPIIGHLHLLFSTSLHKSFQKVSSKYGPLLHLRIFNVRILLVSSASVAYEIFKDHDMSISSHGPIGIDECIVFGSSGFIKAPCGDYWKFVKKIITTKMLGPQALERSRGLREVEIERFYRDLLDKAVKKESVEIGEEALRLVNVILGKMSLGRSFSEEERVSEFSIEIAALTQKIFLQQVLRKPLEKLRISPPFKKEVMSVSYRFGELLEKIIVRYEEKKDEHEGSEIMDALLAACGDEDAEYKINRSHIKALLAELFFGAGDTSSKSTQWAMAEILNNHKIFERLREEIDSVVGKTRLIQETDLPKLPYLQAVIKESLRLHPPGVLLPREFEQGCKIGGLYIPKGTSLVINAYAVMRDIDSWTDPDEFRPERFLGEEDARREHVLNFLPFGAGRRACPGSNVAYILGGITIGVMVQCFDWKVEGVKVNMEEATGRAFLALAHPLNCTPLPRILNILPSNL
ncbi:cytochrome P450 705A1-like [Brassica napus]|uniref:cytochrome P450 705A1-like n=1 Tax=Brassica napus TaxID=3708 RepID=UPI002078F25E|nr:cytochrome P450 705A1-like [Brassica napus]